MDSAGFSCGVFISTFRISIFRRTDTHKLFKHRGKVCGIMVAHHFRDGIDIDIGAAQQLLCLIDAVSDRVFVQALRFSRRLDLAMVCKINFDSSVQIAALVILLKRF